ncbi:hypothetical protein CHS0354_025472 [Potamilus streckersoni]|uniref:Cytochrome P450 n=1 Tax=Potamilus streckersoni TaxID=2493646 RepID=A0AAE0RRG0_9BIVA|nr:hypothetical protein CHS0354_025472 [Potamilus streckersoni]
MFEGFLYSVNLTTAFLFFLVLLSVYYITKLPPDIPPFPKPVLPIFGNLLSLVSKDVLEYFRKLRNEYGDIYSFYMGNQLIIVINGYSAIKEALVQNGRFFSDRPRNFLSETLNENSGIIFTSGAKWKEHRRFAVNALQNFGFGRPSFEQNILEEAQELVKIFEEQNGQPFQPKGIVNTCVANIISQIVFGKRFKHTDANFRDFLNKMDISGTLLGNASVLVNCFPCLQYLPGDPLKMRYVREISKDFNRWFRCILEDHKNTFEEGSVRDFIDLYISEARKREQKEGELSTFTDLQLYISIGNLFGAGSETTATCIRWILLHFLHFPEIQKKCFEEIDQVVGRERLPQLIDKEHLSYLEATILEILRVYPVAPLAVPHAVSKEILFHGYRIPIGTTIIINLDSVLRDSSTFKDPDIFRPERYLDADGHITKPEAHIPFSIGRRVCLGESVARMELFLFLAALIQRFEFLPVEGESLPERKGILGIAYSPVPFLIRAVRRS